MKNNNFKQPVNQRIGVPKIERDKQGNAILLCPFCNPTHPLRAENDASCGTVLQVRAVQMTYKAKFDKRLICVKCMRGGGEMVRFQNGFVHTHDCSPGVVTLEKPPEFSKFAERVYGMRPMIKKVFENLFGTAVPVLEVMPGGEKTGVTLGYFFKKKHKSTAQAVEA